MPIGDSSCPVSFGVVHLKSLTNIYDWAILSPHRRGRIFNINEGLMHVYVWRLAVHILLFLTISRLGVPFRLLAQGSDHRVISRLLILELPSTVPDLN